MHKAPGKIYFFKTLAKTKLKIFKNQSLCWASRSKILFSATALILTSLLIGFGAADFIPALESLPFGQTLTPWILALALVYFIIVVFTGDMITGHSLNTGQVSSDFKFLNSLPIPPLSIIGLKLFERLATDYLGIMILLSGFFGIICRDDISFNKILLSLVLFTQISLLIGLLINLLLVALNRFFRTTTINNIFSLLGYFSAFITLAPYLFVSNYPLRSLTWLLQHLNLFDSLTGKMLLPMKWIAGCLLKASFTQEFIYWTGTWAGLMLIGISIFHLTIKLNWLNYSHSAKNSYKKQGTKFFSGFFQKEYLLIKSDFNLLINAIMMPATIIALEIYFLRDVFNLNSYSHIVNVIFGAIIYFNMFGPLNSIGSEGKAISLLESLPITPQQLLNKKFTFWTIIAEIIFIPATITAMKYLNFNSSAIIEALINICLFIPACVWVSTSLSAVFAKFDTKILQQRSTFLGKIVGIGLMLVAAPIKDLSLNSLISLICFICLGMLIQARAKLKLFYRVDQTLPRLSKFGILETLLFFFSFLAVQISIKQLFTSIAPLEDTGFWHITLTSLLFIPAILFLITKDLLKKSSDSCLKQIKFELIQVLLAISTSTLIVFAIYKLKIPILSLATKFSSDFEQIITAVFSITQSFNTSMGIIISAFLIQIMGFEFLFRGLLLKSAHTKFHKIVFVGLGSLATATYFPWYLFPLFIIFTVISASLNLSAKNFLPGAIFTLLTWTGVLLTLLF